jgi:elongator complex protein 3
MNKKKKIFGAHQIPVNTEKVKIFLAELIKNPPNSTRELEKFKYKFSAEHQIDTCQNRDLIFVTQKNKFKLPEKLQNLLQKRAVRTISGVSPIGILTKPYPCPGQCVYCPTEDRMPKSYMSNQPAAARA